MKKAILNELKSLTSVTGEGLTREEQEFYDKHKFQYNGITHVGIFARPTPEIREMVNQIDKKIPLHVVFIEVLKKQNDAALHN